MGVNPEDRTVPVTKADPTKADILEMAKKLPWDERWELLVALRETLKPFPPPDGMTHEEFLAELDRRWEAVESGQMTSAPWEEVMDRLEKKNRADG
jgi:putative addiction module component (TIGR02574 family)